MLTLDFQDHVFTPERCPDHVATDVLIVGSGAGGAVVAKELTQAGLDVVILEEGPYLTGQDYGSKTPLESVRMLYRKGGFTFTMGNQSVLLPSGRCVGGTTVINSGTSLRADPSAIHRWREEFGLKEMTDRLEQYYRRAENALHVSPVPVETFGRNGALFRKGVEALGWKGSVLTRNERGCQGAGRCFLGCPNDAKQAMNVSYVPAALRAGGRIFTECRVRRVLTEAGRAVGVEAVVEGRRVAFRGSCVVLAAGAVYTPLLLGTVKGRIGRGLGRHLMLHPASRIVGLHDEEVRGWAGVPQGYHVEEFLGQGISIEGIFLPPALVGSQLPAFGRFLGKIMDQYNRLSMLGFRIIEESAGRVLPPILGFPSEWPILWYWIRSSDVERVKRATAYAAEILLAAGARRVFTGIHGFDELRGPADLRRLRETKIAAGDLELSAYHAQGTARMADSPIKGVCDPNGAVWGVKDLYVADASVMPCTPVSNPQLSIMAFATHVAERILGSRGRKLVEDSSNVLPEHAHH